MNRGCEAGMGLDRQREATIWVDLNALYECGVWSLYYRQQGDWQVLGTKMKDASDLSWTA